jgi:hypothetical protein
VITNVSVSAFVEPGATFELEPPREYTSISGEPDVTNWILAIGGYGADTIRLHFRDKTDVYRLIDELTAKAGERP